MAKNFDFFKTLLNGVLTKMQSYAKKSEVYTKKETYSKKETYTRSETDTKVTNLKNSLHPVATTGSYWDLYDQPVVYSDVVRHGTYQSLSDIQKSTARSNIGIAQADLYQTDTTQPDYVKNNVMKSFYSSVSPLEARIQDDIVYDGKTFKPAGYIPETIFDSTHDLGIDITYINGSTSVTKPVNYVTFKTSALVRFAVALPNDSPFGDSGSYSGGDLTVHFSDASSFYVFADMADRECIIQIITANALGATFVWYCVTGCPYTCVISIIHRNLGMMVDETQIPSTIARTKDISSLIDAKLAEIPNASGVSF